MPNHIIGDPAFAKTKFGIKDKTIKTIIFSLFINICSEFEYG